MSDLGDDGYVESGEKFAVIFVIDVSGSMANEIENLSENFNMFLDKSKNNYKVNLKMDLEVITFSHEINTPVTWSNVEGVPYQSFKAYGSTNMRDAMIKAKNDAKQRTEDYESHNIRAYKPWIVLMTDGYSDPDKPVDDIAAELRQREKDGKVHVFALGMGTGFKSSELEKFTDAVLAITDWDFEKFFEWLGRSVAVVSSKAIGSDGPIVSEDQDLVDMIDMNEAFKKFRGTA